MFIQNCFKSVILKLKNLYYALFGSEANEREVQEYFARSDAEYIARLERAVDELTIELDYREYFAKQEAERAEAEREDLERDRENLKYELDRKQDLIEEYERVERERKNREEEDEQLRYQTHCPLCGSKRRHGRCPVCDESFGRN
ncbi:hypothetical protein HY412_00970 [Candidatus Kaiserbacteria bacterium]|nr:hypothetical protein [Candidatus Kaiserbacteria bacterium]